MSSAKPHPTFTIVIPVLNASRTIQKALDSIKAQDFGAYEVLIFDSQSTDNTVQLVSAYTTTDSRFQCICEKDKGIYDAMNKGIRKASGEWLFFLGADDAFYDANVLTAVAATINNSPATQFIYGDVQLSKPLGYHHEGLIYAGAFDASKLLHKNICHQSIFYHRSLFRRFGLFRTEYPIFADYDFNLRCFNKVKSVYINRVIANFTVGGQSKNQQALDRGFEKKFLENVALDYGITFRSPFFDGHEKELLSIMRKKLRVYKIGETIKILRILSYQTMKGFVHDKN